MTVDQKPFFFQRIQKVYQNGLFKFVNILNSYNLHVFAIILGTVFQEPIQAIKAAIFYPLGWKKNFNFYRMNPQKIPSSQTKNNPLLLLHGNLHNQSAWLKLAKKLGKALKTPIYTVNLPSGKFSEKDRKIVNEKINTIKELYSSGGHDSIQIDLIGHSRGATLAYYLGFTDESSKIENGVFNVKKNPHPRADIGKIIKIGASGNVFFDSKSRELFLGEKLFEILGKKDVLNCAQENSIKENHRALLDCGHLGLLYADKTSEKILHFLQKKSSR